MSRRKQVARVLRISAIRLSYRLNVMANRLDPPLVVSATVSLGSQGLDRLSTYHRAVARIARDN